MSYLCTSFSVKAHPVLWSTHVSIRRIGSSSLVYICLCNYFLYFFLFINFVSIIPNFFCNKKKFFLHSFNFRSNNILFMWLILYFLILFISYCSVQYYSSSIYRYILVKKEHDVDHLGKFYVKRRAFIVFWNINWIVRWDFSILLFYFCFFPITGNSKFGNFWYDLVKTLYFRLKIPLSSSCFLAKKRDC